MRNQLVLKKLLLSVFVFSYALACSVASYGGDITVSPGKFDHFTMQLPEKAIAGEEVIVKIEAFDMYDNLITNFAETGKDFKVAITGSAHAQPAILRAVSFTRGTAGITIMNKKTETITLSLYETGVSSPIVTKDIKISPNRLDHFIVQCPPSAVAGGSFDVKIIAKDAFDNLIDNYAALGSGVNISSTGQARVFPSFIGQSEFRGGQAVVKLRYEKAEGINIIATENNKNQTGRSDIVKIHPSAPDKFVTITPANAVAGQKFRIKIEAYDKFDNLVKDYNLTGNDVNLNVTGTGVLSPKAVPAAEFIDGISSVDVIYDKAESFTITALMSVRRSEKAEEKEQIKEETAAPKAVKETLFEEKSKAEAKEVVAEKVVPKAADKTEKVEKPAVQTKQEKTQGAKAEKKVAVKEKKTKEKLAEIKKVSIIEAKNKAMVIINMKALSGEFEYKERRESLHEKEWIVLKLKPAVNKTKAMWKFDSAFVGEVRIEENKAEPGSLSVWIEAKAKDFIVDVNRVKDSLVVSISSP